MLSTIKSRFTSEPQASSLPALLASWPAETAPPRFLGKPKKDLPVDTWLVKVAEACVAKGIPQKLWHEVARHYMSDDARKRVEEVEQVMRCAFGHSWGWKWHTFGVALKNIAGNVDRKKTEAVKVQRKSTGSWWIIGRGGDKGSKVKTKEPLPVPGFIARITQKSSTSTPTVSAPSSTSQKQAPKQTGSKLLKAQPTAAAPPKVAAPSESLVTRLATTLRLKDPPPPPPTTLTAQVPVWLLAASEAIFALTPDTTSTMSILAAVLITVGSIPALPSVAAGTTATALGAVAVGLGTMLRERALAAADDK
ncbi:uncharacterized protein C8Q71DRAFT_753672 [Rhodofomes roseus]|uniref:Uncharacterized protein n=1 Tax=Rhodofomes roseus TaxID=34475 RepID=A0A4Y9Y744_9APHY|nr:uncharacterized protein C8Q71DRAFT_753672 [Rhodofomes roseus]KAH9837637.1 hypothetical protein C8Q71DRAFT_753672 [Rhodofomes roseus]TFY56619.1 hypothetical protein EVJ58_g7525 [Rhodofomes roseus]